MCNCGCNTCESIRGPLLTEGKVRVKSLLSENLQYHVNKNIPLFESVFRIGSNAHLKLIKEARKMYSRDIIDLCEEDEHLIKTHLGEFGVYEGESVPLDLPMLNEANKISDDKLTRLVSKMPKGYVGKNTGIGEYTISTPDGEDIVLTQSKDKKNWFYEPSNVALKILFEAEFRGREVKLNKPKRGGPKKFYVYVRDPKTKRIKKVTFGAAGGGQSLKVKLRDKKARNAFSKRHRCPEKKDRTKASYWSCNLPRYASMLGLGANMNTFW